VPSDQRSGIERAVQARLFERTEDGIQVHDYLEYNPTRARVLAKRKADAERKASERGHAGRASNGQFTRLVRPDSGRNPA
jgi:hypothetical protein